MRKIKLLLLVGCTVLAMSNTSFAKGWLTIVPLVSTKQDVEMVLSGAIRMRDDLYDFNNERVHIVYSDGLCKETPGWWNVPRDTVIAIYVNLKESVPLNSLKIDLAKFKRTRGDYDVPTHFYYVNDDVGLSLSVNQEPDSTDEYVQTYIYAPTSKDNHLRCPK
jgi:hypothetical protein